MQSYRRCTFSAFTAMKTDHRRSLFTADDSMIHFDGWSSLYTLLLLTVVLLIVAFSNERFSNRQLLLCFLRLSCSSITGETFNDVLGVLITFPLRFCGSFMDLNQMLYGVVELYCTFYSPGFHIHGPKSAMNTRGNILSVPMTKYLTFPHSEAEMHQYNAQQQANALRAITSGQTSELDLVGTSSYAPETPAKKDASTPAIQTVIEHNSVKATQDKEAQPHQGIAKRKLTFKEPNVTQATSLPVDKISTETSNAQPVEKGAEEQSTTSANTEARKKQKTKSNDP